MAYPTLALSKICSSIEDSERRNEVVRVLTMAWTFFFFG